MSVLSGMTHHDPILARKSGIVDRFIGLFGSPSGAAANGQLRQLEDIGDFLLTHGLEVTSFTLAAAHDCVSGMDMRLARKVKERVEAGSPVTLAWLEQQRAEDTRHSGAAMIEHVVERLEQSVESLGKTARTAREATHDYNEALTAGNRRLSENSNGNIGELLSLVKEMVDHARTLEGQMRRTEERSREMRRDLERARRVADEDHLTGLPNRRAFEARLHKAIAEKAEDAPLCLGFCDIDHFKLVNDEHGHDVGDRVLKLVATHLVEAIGDGCFVARHGGEEFALLFENTSLMDAREALDATREKLSLRRLTNRKTGEKLEPVSFSAGIARYYEGQDPSLTLRAADQALYSAKREGRNRIVLSE